MTSQRTLYILGALLLVWSCVQAGTPDDSIHVMKQLANDLAAVGKYLICIANLGDDPEILSKAYDVAAVAVRGIKQRPPGPLTSDIIVELETGLVADALAGMSAVDVRCADIQDVSIVSTASGDSEYCSASNRSKSAQDLADLGKALETIGSTVVCLLTNPKPEHLEQIPKLFATSIEDVERQNENATTSVGILLPSKLVVAEEIQKLSVECADTVRRC